MCLCVYNNCASIKQDTDKKYKVKHTRNLPSEEVLEL